MWNDDVVHNDVDDESDKLVSAATVEKPDVPDTCRHAIAVAPKELNAFTDQAKGRALQ